MFIAWDIPHEPLPSCTARAACFARLLCYGVFSFIFLTSFFCRQILFTMILSRFSYMGETIILTSFNGAISNQRDRFLTDHRGNVLHPHGTISPSPQLLIKSKRTTNLHTSISSPNSRSHKPPTNYLILSTYLSTLSTLSTFLFLTQIFQYSSA